MKLISTGKHKYTKDELSALAVRNKVEKRWFRTSGYSAENPYSSMFYDFFEYYWEDDVLTIMFGDFNTIYGDKHCHMAIKFYPVPFNLEKGEMDGTLFFDQSRNVYMKRPLEEYSRNKEPYIKNPYLELDKSLDWQYKFSAFYLPDGLENAAVVDEPYCNVYIDNVTLSTSQKRMLERNVKNTSVCDYMPEEYKSFNREYIYEIECGLSQKQLQVLGYTEPVYRNRELHDLYMVKADGTEVPIPYIDGLRDKKSYNYSTSDLQDIFDLIHIKEYEPKLYLKDGDDKNPFICKGYYLNRDTVMKFKALLEYNRRFSFLVGCENAHLAIDEYYERIQKGEKINIRKEIRNADRLTRKVAKLERAERLQMYSQGLD